MRLNSSSRGCKLEILFPVSLFWFFTIFVWCSLFLWEWIGFFRSQSTTTSWEDGAGVVKKLKRIRVVMGNLFCLLENKMFKF